MRCVIRRRVYPFNGANELASEDGSPPILRLITSSLALLEMRVVIAQLIWHYDFELLYEGQEIPAFNHLNLSSGLLELRAKEI